MEKEEQESAYIPSEIKTLEDSYTYLSGVGHTNPQEIMNMLFLSIEMQKVNIQARMMMQADFSNEVMVHRIANQVVKMLDERSQQKDDPT